MPQVWEIVLLLLGKNKTQSICDEQLPVSQEVTSCFSVGAVHHCFPHGILSRWPTSVLMIFFKTQSICDSVLVQPFSHTCSEKCWIAPQLTLRYADMHDWLCRYDVVTGFKGHLGLNVASCALNIDVLHCPCPIPFSPF